MVSQTLEKSASVIYHWPRQGEWTYEDYARLPDNGRRYEVIGGKLYMSPAPSTGHQELILALAATLRRHVIEFDLGKIYISPIDVILPDLANPVQPDILFIAKERLEMVEENFIAGIPELIVEVLSPGNAAHDRRTKYNLYMEAGVQEYWIVDPEACLADIYTLYEENHYLPHAHIERGGVIQSKLLPDLSIPLDEVCPS
jgi:Uma2 family endonuclease